jgi:hypothetical protein
MGKDNPRRFSFCITRRLGEAMSEQTHTREVLKLQGPFLITIGI